MRSEDKPYIETDHKGNIYLYWMHPSNQSWHETLIGKLRHINTNVEINLWSSNMPGGRSDEASIKMDYLKPQRETLFDYNSGSLSVDKTQVDHTPPHDC